MRKALVSPLKDIHSVYKCIVQTISGLSLAELQVLAEQEGINDASTQSSRQQQLVTRIVEQLTKLYEPTCRYLQSRVFSQHQLQDEQYIPYRSNEGWRTHLADVKSTGNQQLLSFLYERALIPHCDSEVFWQEYFTLLQSQDNHHRALYLLRSHSPFFMQLSTELLYYWLELEERQNSARARELFQQLETTHCKLQTFLKHIELEMRSKQYANVKQIYKTILTVFSHNLEIVGYVALQYAQFCSKYFRDVSSSKQLLNQYFHSYPYCEALFIGYLQFFIAHVECKEGSKESKQNYDQFINVLVEGLKRTIENSNNYAQIKSRSINLLRKYVTSIFVIKGAQKKIKEMEKSSQQSKKRSSQTNIVVEMKRSIKQ